MPFLGMPSVFRITGVLCSSPPRPGGVTWLALGSRCGDCVPRQQVHQQLSLPAPRWVVVGQQAGVGVGEAAARPCYRSISDTSPGPGTHAVLAFTPPQAFIGTKPIVRQAMVGLDTRCGGRIDVWFSVCGSLTDSCRPAIWFPQSIPKYIQESLVCLRIKRFLKRRKPNGDRAGQEEFK